MRLLPAYLLLLPTLALAQQTDAVRQLHALFDSTWERELKEDPESASGYGDKRYNSLWQDVSITATEKRNHLDEQTLKDLSQIPRDELPPQDQLNYDLFGYQYRQRIESRRFKPYLYPISQIGGIQTASDITDNLSFDSVKDYEDWVSRLRAFGTYADQTIALLTQGIREHRVQPRVIMERVLPQLASQIVTDATKSPYYAPFRKFPDAVSGPDRDRLTAEAQRSISTVVVPAYQRLDRFLRERYLPACRTSIGLWDTPDGDAYYRFRVARYTTLKMDPEQIHQTGLREVTRIRGEMDSIITQVGFKGSFADFLQYLRTDPKFYYKTSDELLNAYAATAKKIDPELVKLFGKLPRTPYGVRAVPETSAGSISGSYYEQPALDGSRAGYFYANVYKPEKQPKFDIEALVLHEAVPGHHLQISLAQEQGEQPMFRRTAGFTAYVEGWGLYAESLGSELGMYTDPYSKFGRLNSEMWRALRLVVDTGIHAKHWTREQAIQMMRENSGRPESELALAADRYIAIPGQALAYKIGELQIRAMRDEAKQALGERFDLKQFHDLVLSTGAVPLEVLESTVQKWEQERLASQH
jgi:uncharacterized protein (DUF885 family)